MMISPSIHPAAEAIQTRDELGAVLVNIVELQRARDELRRHQEAELDSVRQRYLAPLAEIERFLAVETGWVEAWAAQHPDAMDGERKLVGLSVDACFQTLQPQIERASRRWTWTRIARGLADSIWGRRYLRQPAPEVDKEAILADLPRLNLAELREAGLRVIHGERLVVQPRPPSETAAKPVWRGAA